jgi:hypothetical protein
LNDHDDKLIRPYAIPAWMVWGVIASFTALIIPAAGTIGGVIVVDRQQLHENTQTIGYLNARLARNEEKTKDILDALNGIRNDIKELMRRMP